jgi:hypothetical protein
MIYRDYKSVLKLQLIYLQMQQTAKRRAESSGGAQSGKNGFNTYVLKVRATMACEHKRMNAMNGPKVSIM